MQDMEPGGDKQEVRSVPRSPSELAASTSRFKAGKSVFPQFPWPCSALGIPLHVVSTLVTLSTEQISVLLSKFQLSRVNQSCSAEAPLAVNTSPSSHVNVPSTFSILAEVFCTGVLISLLSATHLKP